MPASLLVVRHGQSTWNAEGRWQGWADPALTALGEEQAREAAGRLGGAGLTAVTSSDLARARRTAEIFAEALGIPLAAPEPGLREYDVGDWCGLTRPEIEARWPGLLEEWNDGRLQAAPGGESRRSFVDRAEATLTRMMGDERLGERPVLVSHGGLVRAVQRTLGAGSHSVGNLSGWWIERQADGTIRAGAPVVLLGGDARTMSPSG